MSTRFIKINPADNVVVAVDPLKKGDRLTVDGIEIVVAEDIPAGHKVALQDFAADEHIIKYGYPIGHARAAIAKRGVGEREEYQKPISKDCSIILIPPNWSMFHSPIKALLSKGIVAKTARWVYVTRYGLSRQSVA